LDACARDDERRRRRVERETKTKTSSTEKRRRRRGRRRARGDVGAEAGGRKRLGQRGGEDAVENPRKPSPGRDRPASTRRDAQRLGRDRGRLSQPRRDTTRLVSSSLATASAGGPGAEGPGKESRGRTIAAFARFRSDAARWTRGSSPRAGRATASWRGRAGARPVTISRSLGAPARFGGARRFRVRSRSARRVTRAFESRFFRQLYAHNTRFYD
jgi:hypothetical protein